MESDLKLINKKIIEAETKGEVPANLYREQLRLLHFAHDEFIQKAKSQGYDLNNNLDVMDIEIQQYSAMKLVAEKLGENTQKYDTLIKDVRIRVLGEEAVIE